MTDALLAPNVRSLATTLEVYVCGLTVDSEASFVQVSRRAPPRLPAAVRRRAATTTRTREYRHRHQVYQMDRQDDSRRVWTRTPICEVADERLYGLALREEPQPVHKFPSTLDIDCADIERTVYRTDHPRVSIVVEHEPSDDDANTTYTTFVRVDLQVRGAQISSADEGLHDGVARALRVLGAM